MKSAIALFTLLAAVSCASATVYSTGFETTDFTAGASVNGIGGWTMTDQADRLTATVVDSKAATGTQSLKVAMIPHWTGSTVALTTPTALSGTVTISWDFFQDNTGSEAPLNNIIWIGNSGGTPIDIRISGSGVVTAYSGWAEVAVGNLTAGQWNSFSVVLDTDTDTFNISLNGVLVWETAVAVKSFTDVSNVNLITFYQEPYRRGTYYIDNMTFSDEPATVPEPASLVIFGLAGAALLIRRR